TFTALHATHGALAHRLKCRVIQSSCIVPSHDLRESDSTHRVKKNVFLLMYRLILTSTSGPWCFLLVPKGSIPYHVSGTIDIFDASLLKQVTAAEKSKCQQITDFIARVRAVLEDSARAGRTITFAEIEKRVEERIAA